VRHLAGFETGLLQDPIRDRYRAGRQDQRVKEDKPCLQMN